MIVQIRDFFFGYESDTVLRLVMHLGIFIDSTFINKKKRGIFEKYIWSVLNNYFYTVLFVIVFYVFCILVYKSKRCGLVRNVCFGLNVYVLVRH